MSGYNRIDGQERATKVNRIAKGNMVAKSVRMALSDYARRMKALEQVASVAGDAYVDVLAIAKNIEGFLVNDVVSQGQRLKHSFVSAEPMPTANDDDTEDGQGIVGSKTIYNGKP